MYYERDRTDLGLIDWQPLYDAEVARRRRSLLAPTAPRPRPPAEDELDTEVSLRPDLHTDRIYRRMGWVRDPRKRRECPACLARPGAECVTDTGRRMKGLHPDR